MSTTKQLLAQLNDLRVESGKPPLKVWKGSHADLLITIEALSPKKKTEAAPSKATPRPKKKEALSVAEWCEQQGLNPKVARAKLRKSGLKKDGPWVLTPEVKSILTAN